jgi:enamine deaminase RidA (YjgF/YER057c/UK114 family)
MTMRDRLLGPSLARRAHVLLLPLPRASSLPMMTRVHQGSSYTPSRESLMQTQFLNPSGLGPTVGWTHVVTQTGGKTVYISGQVSVNGRGEVVGKGDMRKQTEQAFENLKVALAAVGATFADVVKSNLYVVGLKPEHVPAIREVRGRYFSADRPPASTLVGVAALVNPDWLIEIELVAVLPE